MVGEIKAGTIDTGDFSTGVNTFENTARTGIRPPLGTSKYGEFQSKETLQEIRPLDG
jgi:hypothetical protein